jgi:N-acetylmuramic acid 6-phosphate etherase
MKSLADLQNLLNPDFSDWSTESPNPRTLTIDRMPVADAVDLFIQEDQAVMHAIAQARREIAQTVDLVVAAFQAGGRLVYIGAGTSGRLAFLDAAECPPTFGVPPTMVVALMAGGEKAFQQAVEGAEDSRHAAIEDLKSIRFAPPDILIGIAASGHTPYVRSGLEYARGLGAKTVLMACNAIPTSPELDVLISLVVGPEFLTGSTRLKSGTACKIALNMISTISMINIGKAYKNLMVDVIASNSKLHKRARRIVMNGGQVDEKTAEELLAKTKGEVKTAIFLARRGGTPEAARQALQQARGFLSKALQE